MTHPRQLPPPSFPIRRRDFAFDQQARYWFEGDPFMTMFANVLSSLFPPGERFFMDSLRAVRDRVDSPELLADIRAFLGQEAMHSRGHGTLNAHIVEQGVDVKTLERWTSAILKLVRRVFSPMQQLAITCAIEHFTATLSAHLLRREDMQRAFGDPKILSLWMWHAVEEVEHKALSMDVYRSLGGGELTRIALMALTGTVMSAVIVLWQLRLMGQDGQLLNVRTWVRGLRRLLGRRGFLTQMMFDLHEYYRPGFHPNDQDPGPALDEARERYAAA